MLEHSMRSASVFRWLDKSGQGVFHPLSLAPMALAAGTKEEFLKTETEMNVTFLIKLPVADLTVATHVISWVTMTVTLLMTVG